MTYTDKHIVETYSELIKGLSLESKHELIANLSESVEVEKESKETMFYKSFGSFASCKEAEEIINEIKSNRRFSNKEIQL